MSALTEGTDEAVELGDLWEADAREPVPMNEWDVLDIDPDWRPKPLEPVSRAVPAAAAGPSPSMRGRPPGVRYPSVFADLFALDPLPVAVPDAAVDAAGPTDWPPVPTGLFPLTAQALTELKNPSAAESDAYYVPRDPRFESTFIFGDQPVNRPPLIFADPLPLPSATGGASLSFRAEDAVLPERGEIQSPTLTILFASLVITLVLLFVYLVVPLLR